MFIINCTTITDGSTGKIHLLLDYDSSGGCIELDSCDPNITSNSRAL